MATATAKASHRTAATRSTAKFLTLSFSGGGHLLSYHLGVAGSLYSAAGTTKKIPPIKAVAGSSSGAIAATVLCHLPHRIDEYADIFMKERGNAIQHLTNFLYQEEISNSSTTPSSLPIQKQVIQHANNKRPPSARLYICTTKTLDGSAQIFGFEPKYSNFSSISTSWKTDEILKCVKASCTIPSTFHPWDLVSKGELSYLDSDGILLKNDGNDDPSAYGNYGNSNINESYYVDGGISQPAPPTPLDLEEGFCPITISPISGPGKYRISPVDRSLGSSWKLTCRGDFQVRPSFQNLKALQVASGMAATTEELTSWYQRGVEDAEKFVQDWNKN